MGWFLLCSSSLLFFAVIASSGSLANLPIIAFEDGYTPLFGDHNLAIHRDGKSVHLSLDERTGLFLCFIRFFLTWSLFFFYFCHVFSFSFLFFWAVISGSGFVSHDLYLHGYFSASIKLPSDYTAGVVVAFYVSNNGF